MQRKIDRFIKLYPWYAGFTGDLLFYVAIGQLFLTVVRNFTSAEIVSITTVSTIVSIVFYFPVLWVIKRIKHTTSARLSGFFIFLAALCHTFGLDFHVVTLGQVFLNISANLKQISFVVLENNLKLADKQHLFLKVRTDGNTVYAVLTMIVSLVASFMFNLNNYLPMICCSLAGLAGFIISFFMVDYSEPDKREISSNPIKANYTLIVILIMACCGLFFALANTGQTNQQLFIQENLLVNFSVEQTSLILGVVLVCSRFVRVVSNKVFPKVYGIFKKKTGIVLAFMMVASYVLSALGSLIPFVMIKMVVMSLGFIFILLIRDPFNLFLQDILFENSPNDQHSTLLTNLHFGMQLAIATTSTVSSLILLKFPLVFVIGALFLFAVVELLIVIKLYGIIKDVKQVAES